MSGLLEFWMQLVISINKPYPIPEIYMNCMISICRIKNKNLEGAKEAFLTAWEMAKPDGLLEAFIEHHGLLTGRSWSLV